MAMWVFRWTCMGEFRVARRAYAAGSGKDITKLVFLLEVGLRFSEMMKVLVVG
jgi:hypothetical protein